MANALYPDHAGPLLLLTLDPERIGADIRWEPVPGHAGPFPHIYGPVPVAAVLRAVPLDRDLAGQFSFPAGPTPPAGQ